MTNNQFPIKSGVVTTDPLTDIPIGGAIRFQPRLFSSTAPEGLDGVANWDFFNGALIGLVFGSMEKMSILGCGILVAPGIAIAARHVIEPEFTSLDETRGILCVGVGINHLMFWRPHQVTYHSNNDLAVITLHYASQLPETFDQAAITTRTPKIGERVVIAGLVDRGSSKVGEKHATMNLEAKAAVGKVTARYDAGRDRIMLPGPSLEIDCPALGGMSGGPAFDETGHLVGILSTSVDDPSGKGPAFVSMLWPALGLEIVPTWPSGFYKPTKLLDLDDRICAIHGRDAIDLLPDGRMQYRIWE